MAAHIDQAGHFDALILLMCEAPPLLLPVALAPV